MTERNMRLKVASWAAYGQWRLAEWTSDITGRAGEVLVGAGSDRDCWAGYFLDCWRQRERSGLSGYDRARGTRDGRESDSWCEIRGIGEDWSMSDAFTSRVLNIASGSSERVVDLTGECEAFLREVAGDRDGLLNVFVPHATAGVALIETGAGSDDDLLAALHALLPADDRWQHRHGSPGHGRDHVLPAIVPPHATLPVLGGRLELGTWQSVCLVDTNRDNPDRRVRLSFLG